MKISVVAFLLLSMVATSSVVASTGNIETMRFNASASGPCFILYGQGEEGPSPFPDPIYYAGPGNGRARISGLAKNTNPSTSFLGEGYTSEHVKVWSVASASWIENDGTDNEDRHWLLVVLYSSSTTEGFFKPDPSHDQQILAIPEPGVGGEDEALMFTGVHVSSSGFQSIKGFAVYLTLPAVSLYPECPNCNWFPEDAYFNWLVLADEDFVLYQLMWSEILVPDSVCPFGTIPATESIQWSVEAIY
jgi:hypothetical protein